MKAWAFAAVVLAGYTLAGCANSSVVPLAQDTFQITTAASPICGPTGAQKVASSQAAIETIRRGYDRYVIIGSEYKNDTKVTGYIPSDPDTVETTTVTTYTANGAPTTETFVGGDPIIGGTHNQGLTVRMFKEGDPGAATAVAARETLGPNWQSAVANGTATCFGV